VLGEETKGQCGYTKEEEKIRCPCRGISAGRINNVLVA